MWQYAVNVFDRAEWIFSWVGWLVGWVVGGVRERDTENSVRGHTSARLRSSRRRQNGRVSFHLKQNKSISQRARAFYI